MVVDTQDYDYPRYTGLVFELSYPSTKEDTYLEDDISEDEEFASMEDDAEDYAFLDDLKRD